MNIYLLRHGESTDDIEDCYGGIADFPLTEAGKRTAEALAQKLSASKIEILYSSPYKRALETAKFISGSLRCELKVIPDLRERNSYGVLSGVKKEVAKQIFADVISGLKSKPGDYYAGESVIGDEPVVSFDARVKDAIGKVIGEATNTKTIGIVTHGNVTRSIYKHLLGVAGKVDLDLLAMTIIESTNGRLTIKSSEGVTIKN